MLCTESRTSEYMDVAAGFGITTGGLETVVSVHKGPSINDVGNWEGGRGGGVKNWSKLPGGRHIMDIIGDISWTKEVTYRGHFW